MSPEAPFAIHHDSGSRFYGPSLWVLLTVTLRRPKKLGVMLGFASVLTRFLPLETSDDNALFIQQSPGFDKF